MNFSDIIKSHGFAFNEDYLSGKTKYFNQDLEIEFLSKITRENKHVIEVKKLGIGVECLSGLELIDHNHIVYTWECDEKRRLKVYHIICIEEIR